MATAKANALSKERKPKSAARNGETDEKFKDQPYLRCLEKLQSAFPPLQSFLKKVNNTDKGRRLVEDYYRKQQNGRVPGRCYCLQFEAEKVTVLEGYHHGFANPADLAAYLTKHPASSSRQKENRRLFILEDLEPDYIDVLGHYLGVDPLAFSEQMNTWNFTDSNSIPHRGLPSVCTPGQSFTLRYYEIRTLDDPKSIDALTLQMTFAVNRRRYERWRDIDLPLSGIKDKRHAFIRRCASFWTSQDQNKKEQGWDALLLVDPGMACVNVEPNTTFILQDPNVYGDRARLWNAHDWNSEQDVMARKHKSWPYHDGCPTLAQLLFSQVSAEAQVQMVNFQSRRDLASPLDEQVFYWTKVASKDLIKETKQNSSNAAYYLLKHVAQHWTNQLELINCTVAKGEYLSDDYQATIDDNLSQKQWKADLIQVNQTTRDINYMRRQMNNFWRAMVMNLERLGIQLGCEQVDTDLSLALQGAQKDLLTIHTRMQPLRERLEALTAIANDLANLHAAFRGVHDSEFGLRLSLLASIFFPLTLVASIFSMNDSYLPGAKWFWKFWAISLPFVFAFAIVLAYGWRPYRIVCDAKEYILVRDWTRKKQAEKRENVDSTGEQQMLKKRMKRHNSLC